MDLAILLLMSSRVMTEAVHEALAAEGHPAVRPAHGFAFQLIASTGGATAADLAAHLGVSRQAGKQMADELIALGYVMVEADPADARLRRLILTRSGEEVIALAIRFWDEQERRWQSLIGPQAMNDLKAGLRSYLSRNGALDGPPRLKPVW